jgi:hypothetical protein
MHREECAGDLKWTCGSQQPMPFELDSELLRTLPLSDHGPTESPSLSSPRPRTPSRWRVHCGQLWRGALGSPPGGPPIARRWGRHGRTVAVYHRDPGGGGAASSIDAQWGEIWSPGPSVETTEVARGDSEEKREAKMRAAGDHAALASGVRAIQLENGRTLQAHGSAISEPPSRPLWQVTGRGLAAHTITVPLSAP